MSSPTQSRFRLDPAIFNDSLYDKLIALWFPGMDLTGRSLSEAAMNRWFKAPPDEKMRFDGECRANFEHALDAIGPEQLPHASAQPFLDELQRVEAEQHGERAAWTALSLTLLLDQIPRNIYRTQDCLPKVYNHYDAMSYRFVSAILSDRSPIARPDLHPVFSKSGSHRLWFYMPFMHSEQIEAHDRFDRLLADYARGEQGRQDNQGSMAFYNGQITAEKEHRDILDRFGRYPHRNEALGRQTTPEEKSFLEQGGATFGVAQSNGEDAS